jgi:hypothetical protein
MVGHMQIPSLLLGVAGRPAQHQAICLRLATAALEHLPSSGIAASTLPIKGACVYVTVHEHAAAH